MSQSHTFRLSESVKTKLIRAKGILLTRIGRELSQSEALEIVLDEWLRQNQVEEVPA